MVHPAVDQELALLKRKLMLAVLIIAVVVAAFAIAVVFLIGQPVL
jgi:hypothetical protein